MTCRTAQIGSGITSYVLQRTGLAEQQVLSMYHEVMREGRDATAPSETQRQRLIGEAIATVSADSDLTEHRRRSIVTRLERARTEPIDGRRYYATTRLLARAERAQAALASYVADTARELGVTESAIQSRMNILRDEAGGDRNLRPSPDFVQGARNQNSYGDLPMDRQTAYAIEAIQADRRTHRSSVVTRPTVTRHPVESRAIREMGYDPATGRVEVVLHSNPEVPYAYRMTPHQYEMFANAHSVGSYYATEVRANDEYRYADATSAREAGEQAQCGTCGQFAGADHACPPRGSVEERELTEQRARQAVRRTPAAAPIAAEPALPRRIGGTRRSYIGDSGSFNTPALTSVQQTARANPAGVRVPVTSTIRAFAGADGEARALTISSSVTGHALVTYNGRGRGYTVTNEDSRGANAATGTSSVDRLRCRCPQYRTNYDCVHVRQTIQDLTTRLNADSVRDRHLIGPAVEQVTADLRRDLADSVSAQDTSRATWAADPTYTNSHAAFQADYRAAKAKIAAGESPLTYMTENATDGLGAPGTGRAFGVELEFVIGGGHDRATALRAIGRDLHAAGLTPSAAQRGYHSTPGRYSRNHQGGWKFETDCTVHGEIISPIMHDTPETWENIAKICEIVKRHGGEVNTRAGSHVHVGAGNYDHTVANHNRLLASFAENEDLVYRLSSNPVRGSHRGPSWCAPNRIPTSGYRSVSDAQSRNNSHNLGMNLQGVSGQASDHVEFRTFDGTLEPAIVQTQIKMALAMTEAAFRDTTYQPGQHTPLGSHRSHNRQAFGQSRRLTGDEWRQDVSGYKVFADRLFRRPEDKAQLTGLLAWTKWQKAR